MKHKLFFLALLLWSTATAQDFRNRYYYFNDFISIPNNNGGGNDLSQIISGTGAVHTVSTVTATNQVGIVTAETGTTATGRAASKAGSGAVMFGGGAWSFEIKLGGLSSLCSATQSYAVLLGFFDINTAVNQNDGIYFLYDSIGTSAGSFSSDRWQTVTAAGGSRTFTETSVDVSTGGVLDGKFRIEVNADGTQADFYINDNLVRSETATMPSGSSRETGFGFLIIKSVGNLSVIMPIDYLWAECVFTTKR